MKPILFVDGYNVIGAWPQAQREGWPLEEARDRLTHLLEDYAGYTGQEIKLVFDGHHSDRLLRSVDEKSGLTVIYTKHGETADQYIERSCGQLPVYREARVA
ncbi:MAG: NYN domain-containing protein, partial [Eubacteriales bacterium]|nr:NYN domain-containing protein [Eubacteriales bacterium]